MGDPAPLSAAESAQLVEFARACKAATRAVSLYPETHPAIAATVERIVDLTSAANLTAPLRIAVVKRALQLNGRPLEKVDSAAGELAALLHDHVIGELVIRSGGTADEWRKFLRVLGRPPEEVRAEGGITRAFANDGSGHIDIREIDYALVLQERSGLTPADWEQVIAACLQDDARVDRRLVSKLLDAAEAGHLGELLAAADRRGSDVGKSASARAQGILRLLHAMVEAAESETPERVDAIMRAMSAALAELSPDVILALVNVASQVRASAVRTPAAAAGGGPGTNPAGDTSAALAALAEAMLGGMSNETIAHFLARHVGEPDSSTVRLAQAFQALVQDGERRERLLTLAHDEARASPLGQSEQFEDLWGGISQKLTAYSDRPFVSDEYARELTRAQTVPIEQAHDDPPERIDAWVATVATEQLRGLDLVVVTDLLRLERDPDKSALLTPAVLSLLGDCLLVGDLDSVEQLLDALRDDDGAMRRHATPIVAALTGGAAMRHVLSLLTSGDDTVAARVQSICLRFGGAAVRPLVEALAKEERMRARERLLSVLREAAVASRPELDALKSSADPAVRRTAVHVLRELGESEVLPDTAVLGNEHDAQAQRDAVRAVLAHGSERAYRLVEQVLAAGTPASRDAVMHAIAAQRDERSAGLYAFLVRQLDHRGALATVYQRAIQALGASKNPDAVTALESALYRRGDWWAPGRIAAIRTAAATALARIATADAIAALNKAAESGPRRLRAAVRPHLRTERTPR